MAIYVQQKHNRPVCRHFLTHGPTGWQLHNRSANLLMLILNCFGFVHCIAAAWPCACQVGSQSQRDVSCFRFRVVCPATLLLFTMTPSSAFRTVFARNVLSLSSRASLDLTGTLIFYTKNVLFLAHCRNTAVSSCVCMCSLK